MPPSSNPEYIKIDDQSFYLAKTSSEQFGVENIKDEIASLRNRIDNCVTHLQCASAEGVKDAEILINELIGQPLSKLLE